MISDERKPLSEVLMATVHHAEQAEREKKNLEAEVAQLKAICESQGQQLRDLRSESATAVLTKERDAATAACAAMREAILQADSKRTDGLEPPATIQEVSARANEFVAAMNAAVSLAQQPSPGQPLLDRLAAAQAERDRAWGVVHGTQSKTLVEDNQRLTAEVERLTKAHEELASVSNDRLRTLEHLRDLYQAEKAEVERLKAELEKSNYWRKRHLELAESRGQQVQELWAKWKDTEAEPARIKAAIEAVPLRELQAVYLAALAQRDNSSIDRVVAIRSRLLAEFDKPKPKPDEIHVGDTVECVDDSTARCLQVGRRYTVSYVGPLSDGEPGIGLEDDKKPEWMARRFRKVQPVEIPEEKTWGKEGIEIAKAVLSDAARLAELEAYEADAKRWRACKEAGQFPRPVYDRWYIDGQYSGTYDTPEAAVDAATKGGAQ